MVNGAEAGVAGTVASIGQAWGSSVARVVKGACIRHSFLRGGWKGSQELSSSGGGGAVLVRLGELRTVCGSRMEIQLPSLQYVSQSVTLSLALESGVLLAVHCHELLSV